MHATIEPNYKDLFINKHLWDILGPLISVSKTMIFFNLIIIHNAMTTFPIICA